MVEARRAVRARPTAWAWSASAQLASPAHQEGGARPEAGRSAVGTHRAQLPPGQTATRKATRSQVALCYDYPERLSRWHLHLGSWPAGGDTLAGLSFTRSPVPISRSVIRLLTTTSRGRFSATRPSRSGEATAQARLGCGRLSPCLPVYTHCQYP